MSDDGARQRFSDHLARARLRLTSPRRAILNAASACTEHVTAEELHERARRIDASVSRATVYRTLPILVASGVLREVDIGRSLKFYVSTAGSEVEKAQVVCLDCDHIFEHNAPFLGWYAESACARFGLEPASTRLQVLAHCPDYRAGRPCTRRPAAGN